MLMSVYVCLCLCVRFIRILSVSGVFLLSSRHDVELARAKKPTLRGLLQGDASAAHPLAQCVSCVYTPEELSDCLGAAAAVIDVRQLSHETVLHRSELLVRVIVGKIPNVLSWFDCLDSAGEANLAG